MINLASTSDLIQVITGTSLNVDVHASWIDFLAAATTPGRTDTLITTASTTTIVASPALSSTIRDVLCIEIHNRDASTSCAVTVKHTDGSNAVVLRKCTLLAGQSLTYDEGHGWRILNPAHTANNLAKFLSTGTDGLGNSIISDDGTAITIAATGNTAVTITQSTSPNKTANQSTLTAQATFPFDTTAGNLSNVAFNLRAAGTVAAGTHNLTNEAVLVVASGSGSQVTNIGLVVVASGGATNVAIETTSGDLTWNATGGNTITNGTATTTNVTPGLIANTPERLSSSGAASAVKSTTFVSGVATALTLANGTVDGQIKDLVVTGGSGTLTPANPNFTVATWSGIGGVRLIWDATATKWNVFTVGPNMVIS